MDSRKPGNPAVIRHIAAFRVRAWFGRDARKPLTGMGDCSGALGIADSGSEYARSGGAVRSARRKLVLLLRLSRTEPDFPSS